MSSPILTRDEILKSIVSRSLLLQVGNSAVAIIKARTLRGEYLDGSDSNAGKYSTKPAPMPYGALIARLGKGKAAMVLKRIDRKDEPGSVYTMSKAGKIWIVLHDPVTEPAYYWLYDRNAKTLPENRSKRQPVSRHARREAGQ